MTCKTKTKFAKWKVFFKKNEKISLKWKKQLSFDEFQCLCERLHWLATKKMVVMTYGWEIQSDKNVPGVQGARLIRQSVRGLQATTAHTHLACTWNKPIKYLLDDLHQILQNLPTLADILVCNDGCGQVTQDVGAHGLDRVEVSGCGKDKRNYFIALIKGAVSRLEWHPMQHFGCLFDSWHLGRSQDR